MEDTISTGLQNSIVYLSITDTEFLKIIAGQVPPEFLTSEVAQIAYKCCLSYFKSYKVSPGDHFHDELLKTAQKLNEDEREAVARYVLNIKTLRPNRDYVISRLDDFIRTSAFMTVTYRFAELVEGGRIDDAIRVMNDAMKSGIDKKPDGSFILDDFSDIDNRGDHPEYLMPCGIPALDARVGGFSRGEFVLLVGGYKGQKSWFGHHVGKQGLLRGLNVLHASHENALVEVTSRYDMMFGALLNEPESGEVELKWMGEDGRIQISHEMRDTIYNRIKVIENRKRVRRLGGRLMVKKWPMGSCSAVDLEAFMDRLETYENFTPDLVITDYADIMKPMNSGRDTRDILNETYIYLKRIADERQCVMVTMSQVNREGVRASRLEGQLEGSHVAEDIRKIATIDKGFFIALPRELQEDKEAVVGCFANRNKVQDISCYIGQNLRIGQFCTYSYDKREVVN